MTEGRPDATGVKMAHALDEMGVPSTLVLDSGVAYSMERCGWSIRRAVGGASVSLPAAVYCPMLRTAPCTVPLPTMDACWWSNPHPSAASPTAT